MRKAGNKSAKRTTKAAKTVCSDKKQTKQTTDKSKRASFDVKAMYKKVATPAAGTRDERI